jgi:Flp pilus assembly pilin Flp
VIEAEAMWKRLTTLMKRLAREEDGQATSEYLLVIGVMIFVPIVMSTAVLSGLSSYYQQCTTVVCLPIP